MKSLFMGIVVVIVAVVFVPGLNEDWLSRNLEPTFETFKGVTTKNYPDKTEREAAFAKVLAEKSRIAKEDSWPFMTCEATFTARNPGTIHRMDVRNIVCSWGRS